MSRKYKLAVFIGRFQPFHLGHKSVVDGALELADNVLILIGSCGGPRTHRNPFTLQERCSMIHSSMQTPRVKTRSLFDHLYNDERWVEDIQRKVRDFANQNDITDNDITLVGHSKDESSYYLKLFPQWHHEDCGKQNDLDGTKIRESYFARGDGNAVSHTVPYEVFKFLMNFDPDAYMQVEKEFEYVRKYKELWYCSPFPPTFVTVDAVVVQSGHILLVKRGGFPGKGLWALPGGFLNTAEKIEDSVIRELREETKIKVPDPVLRGSISKVEVFDDPNRSSRGRTITHAFLINLRPEETLPKVKGADDAEKARWVPLSEINREEMFEDHYFIIEKLVGLS